ncbi:MAG: hypothetical protein WBD41_06050 [Rhodococcus sp. (in: high G+C Gram-positive bacteria)]|jgi:hypothetical protein|uniref:hypothetical protein n=1 Tax=Rhodococcus sp. EPR-157 TaxID=1813677 RepID=UPI0007BB957E|nr:hypothetical protein [Rhodococcus sp. EPR-157]KZF03835.1 hypothetical protein A2J03_06530 [Rhodococcus sp. EPR-157]
MTGRHDVPSSVSTNAFAEAAQVLQDHVEVLLDRRPIEFSAFRSPGDDRVATAIVVGEDLHPAYPLPDVQVVEAVQGDVAALLI